MYRKFIKRLVDILISSCVIVLCSPLFIMVALLILIQDGGNPIFKQDRVGVNKSIFTLMKFRSMPINTANVPSADTSKIKITTFGAFIRRSNLDELPQFFNILVGDMSFIGPRPSLPNQINLVGLRSDKNVYSCKPGLTGLAQVNSFDGMTDGQKAEWDGKYASNISFVQDFKIFLKTFIYLTKKPPTY